MINYDLSYSEIKARQKARNEFNTRQEKLAFYADIKIMFCTAAVFIILVSVSNMAYYDCVKLGVC